MKISLLLLVEVFLIGNSICGEYQLVPKPTPTPTPQATATPPFPSFIYENPLEETHPTPTPKVPIMHNTVLAY
jgi:hypothetical protein